MLAIRIGIPLLPLQLPLRKGLHIAAEMGVEAVEIDARNDTNFVDLSRTGVREVRKLLEDLNLRISCVRFRTRRGYDTLADLERRIDATKRAMTLSYDLGCNVVTNYIGRIPPTNDHPAFSTLVDALSDLGRHGQRCGAMLAAETAGDDADSWKRLFAALPAGAILVDLNPAAIVLNSQSPREVTAAVAEYVGHVHASDATRDVTAGRGIVTELGQGSAEFPELLGLLEEKQYQGYITVVPEATDYPREEIVQSVRYLRAL